VENHRLALPHKLFEAMWLGLPVIVPAFAEQVAAAVAEAGCGNAVDTGDPAAIAAAVAQLVDPALRHAMGARGRAAARARFDWSAEAARLVALYVGLLPQPVSARPASASARPSSLRRPADAATSDR
jgi:glycosyltransferase involved in cell wall biosynthesis